VGLLFISRSIGGSLKVLSRVQQYERLLRLAESAFSRLEAEAQHTKSLAHREGLFDPPDEGYRWTLTTGPLQLDQSDIPTDTLTVVTLTVSPSHATSPTVRLHTIWPSAWVTE